MLRWCHANVDDIGDHLMPEQSIPCSLDDLCRAHIVEWIYKVPKKTESDGSKHVLT